MSFSTFAFARYEFFFVSQKTNVTNKIAGARTNAVSRDFFFVVRDANEELIQISRILCLAHFNQRRSNLSICFASKIQRIALFSSPTFAPFWPLPLFISLICPRNVLRNTGLAMWPPPPAKHHGVKLLIKCTALITPSERSFVFFYLTAIIVQVKLTRAFPPHGFLFSLRYYISSSLSQVRTRLATVTRRTNFT